MSVVRCLLIPLAEYNLLIPNVAVSEILSYIEPEPEPEPELAPDTTTPEWMLGKINWRGLTVDLISSEVFSGALLPLPKITQCIAVVRLPQPGERLYCVALLSQRMPRLITVTSDTVQMAESPPPSPCLAGMWVQVKDELALIPDLDALQSQLRAASGEEVSQWVKE